jgi:hypothetical protein
MVGFSGRVAVEDMMESRMVRGVFAMVLAMGLSNSCKKNKDADNSSKGDEQTGTPVASAAAPVDLEAWLRDASAPLNTEIVEKLLLGLKDCNVSDAGIDPNCEGLKRWNKGIDRPGVWLAVGTPNSLGARYITDPSPAVRSQAADLIRTKYYGDAATQKIVLTAAQKEQVPGVLVSMVNALAMWPKVNEDVKQLLLTSADHPSEQVRSAALSPFLAPDWEGVPGTFERVMDKLDNDPAIAVRSSLCSRLYGSSDARAIPLFEKYLTNKATPEDLFKACWEGVIAAWTGRPQPGHPNQRAYELTMKILEATPRTKDRPPWGGMSGLKWAQTEFKSSFLSEGMKDWLADVKGWYKPKRLHKALEAVAGDTHAYWMARTAAAEALKETGGPPEAFERLHKKYEKLDEGDDGLVKKRIEELKEALAKELAKKRLEKIK